MNNTLMVYLNKRIRQNNNKYPTVNHQPGPVICISGEVECAGANIAQMLATELDKQSSCKKWRVLSKEIIEENAMELNMETNRFRNYLNERDKGFFDDILSDFTKNQFSRELENNQPFIDLITNFAHDGHCIIVGMAGQIVARDIEKSLSIKLIAPHGWWIENIIENYDLNLQDALDFIKKMQKDGHRFIKQMGGEIKDDAQFDLILNISKLYITEVVGFIKFAAQTKGLLEPHISKVEVF